MSEIMTFEDRHEPLIIKVKNVKGEETTLRSNFLTAKELTEVEEIGYEAVNRESKDPCERTQQGKLIKMMMIFYGNSYDFWLQFSDELLGKLIDHIRNESKKNLPEQNG